VPVLPLSDATLSAHRLDLDIAGLARQHGALVYRAAYRLLGNHCAAQDIQQDLFVRLLERPPERVQSWPAYLTSCAVRLSIDHLRRQQRWRSYLPFFASQQDSTEAAEHELSAEQDVKRLREGLSRLKPREATCFVMRFIHGSSIAEIAEATDLSTNYVSVSLHRAAQQLESFCGGNAAKEI
jgi:RNA polymerase sigma factor (sigma-70 family)